MESIDALSKKLSEQPKKIAEILLGELDKKEFIDSIEIAGPGFINFFLSQKFILFFQ